MRYVIRLQEGVTLATDFEAAPIPMIATTSDRQIPGADELHHIVAQRVEWSVFHATWEPVDGVENLAYNPRKVITIHDTNPG